MRIQSTNMGVPKYSSSGVQQIWVTCSLAIVFGAADLVRLNPLEFDKSQFNDLRYLGIAIGFAALMASAGRAFLLTEHTVNPLTLVWLLFGSVVFASAIMNGSVNGAYGSLWYLVGVPVICFSAIPRLFHHVGPQVLPLALLLGAAPFLTISVAAYPLKFPFMGIMGNPNSVGVVAAAAGCAFLSMLAAQKFHFRFIYFAILALGLFASIVLCLASGSRTSSITLFVLSVLFAGDWVTSSAGGLKKVFYAAALSLLVVCGLAFALINDSAIPIAGILTKGTETRSGFLPQRSEIWAQTLSDATAFGNGDRYFDDNFSLYAHNSVIGVLGQYGVIPAVVFVIFGLGCLLAAWTYYTSRRRSDPYALTPLLVQGCFWGLSMGEGMFGLVAGAINVAFLISVGITQNEKAVATWSANQACSVRRPILNCSDLSGLNFRNSINYAADPMRNRRATP